MTKIFLPAISLAMLLTSGACMGRQIGISPSNIPVDGKKYKVVDKVSGSAISFDLLASTVYADSTRSVVDRMIKEKNADALVNITWYETNYNFLLFSISSQNIKADAIKLEEDK